MSGTSTKGEKKYDCKHCGHRGPAADFRTPHQKSGSKYYDYCNTCHGEQARRSRYKLLYNITPEEYDKILAFQKGKCFICEKKPAEGRMRLAVDHCHKSGLIRGLLCWHCNRAIGTFRDDQWRLAMAFIYLFAPPAVQALGERRYGVVGRVKKKAKNRTFGDATLDDHHRLDPEALIETIITLMRENSQCSKRKSQK
jgi:hypothetical protein